MEHKAPKALVLPDQAKAYKPEGPTEELVFKINTELVDKYVSDYEEARKANEKNTLKVFDQFKEKDVQYIVLPNNWEDCCKNSYLCLLANRALILNIAKYKPWVNSDLPFEASEIVADKLLFLQGFGVPIVNGEIPKYRSDSRKHFNIGVQTAVKESLSFDACVIDIFKITEATKPIPYYFGTGWKTNKTSERKMFDFLLFALRQLSANENLLTWVYKGEKLIECIGMKIVHNHAIFTPDDQTFIRAEYARELAYRQLFHDTKLDKFESFSAWAHLHNIMRVEEKEVSKFYKIEGGKVIILKDKDKVPAYFVDFDEKTEITAVLFFNTLFATIRLGQQMFKVYKDTVLAAKEERCNTLYKSKRLGHKDKGKQLKELLPKINRTIEYYNGFQPMRMCRHGTKCIATEPAENVDIGKWVEEGLMPKIDNMARACGTQQANYFKVWTAQWVQLYYQS